MANKCNVAHLVKENLRFHRCSDPSELGTHFSSLKCPKCASGGYLVPDDPHQQEICPWSCTVCGEGETSEYVNAVIKVRKLTFNITSHGEICSFQAIGEELITLEKGIPEACAGFIKKHSQNLHPNHYYLMDVKLALSQMMGKIAGDPRYREQKREIPASSLIDVTRDCHVVFHVIFMWCNT